MDIVDLDGLEDIAHMDLLVFVPVAAPAALDAAVVLAGPAWVACLPVPSAPVLDRPFHIGSASAELPDRHSDHRPHVDEEDCIPAGACIPGEDHRVPAQEEGPAAAAEDTLVGIAPAAHHVGQAAVEETLADIAPEGDRLVHLVLLAVELQIERVGTPLVLVGWDHCHVQKLIL